MFEQDFFSDVFYIYFFHLSHIQIILLLPLKVKVKIVICKKLLTHLYIMNVA